MKTASIGDYVKYLPNLFMNSGLMMSVVDIEGDKAKISFIDNDADMTNKEMWVDISDLEVVHHGDGGFRNAGE